MVSRDRYDSWQKLVELIPGRAREGTHLDFKGEPYSHPGKPPQKREEDKYELRRDVVALSNAGGGHLVVGVAEDPERGWARALRPLADPRGHETFIREVTSKSIEPAFDPGELDILIVSPGSDEARGVLVVSVAPARAGRPRAVVIDGKPQFFTRVGPSKREMSYAQIQAAFSESHDGDSVVEGVAIVDIVKIEAEIEQKHLTDVPRTLELLNQLSVYANSYVFGDRVRLAIVNAVGEALDDPRAHIPPAVMRAALSVMEQALPHVHLRYATRNLSDAEIERFRQGTHYAWSLVYDGTRYLQDLETVSVGGRLLWKALRVAQLNNISDLKDLALGYFASPWHWP